MRLRHDKKAELKKEDNLCEVKENKQECILNKKRIIIICLSLATVTVIVTTLLFAQLKFKVITRFCEAYGERDRFSIMTEDKSMYIGLGEEVKLSVSTSFFQGKVNNMKVTSSNEDILSVEDNVIKGEKVGKAILYAKSGKRESYPVNMECIIKVQEIILDKEEIEVSVGYPLKINADIYPKNATYKKLEYTSSDEKIAVIKNDKIIGLNEGACTITIQDKTGQQKKECRVTVKYIPVEDIKLDEEDIQIGVGNQYVLYGRLYPEFASNTEFLWQSSNENVASVENGVITANSVGETEIIVKASEDKISKCKVKVLEHEPTRTIKYVRGEEPLRIKPIDNANEVIRPKRNNYIEILKEYDEWVKVREESGNVGYLPINECTKEKSYYIKNVPFIDQYELGYPTGCEAVSATMVAKYKGYEIEPYTIINNTPTDERGIWKEVIEVEIEKDIEEKELESKDKDVIKETKEVTYGGDPFKVFVGHPSKNYEQGSYGCYAPPIIEALEKCYINCTDISGCTEEELLKNIENENPVVVWGTYDAREIEEQEEWLFPDGQEGSYIHLKGEHCMVLIGYDDDNIYLNDPIAGKDVSQPKEMFFKNWKKLYSQAISIY